MQKTKSSCLTKDPPVADSVSGLWIAKSKMQWTAQVFLKKKKKSFTTSFIFWGGH